MSSLTDPKVTSYSTVTSIDADLLIAEKAYDDLQRELEAMLERGTIEEVVENGMEFNEDGARNDADKTKTLENEETEAGDVVLHDSKIRNAEQTATTTKSDEPSTSVILSVKSRKLTMLDVKEAEEKIQKAMSWRDELRGTRQFLIDRQRWQAERDAKGLFYAIVLCKWNGRATLSAAAVGSFDKPDNSPLNGFTAPNVGDYCTNLFTANETHGVTGVLYVLRGWFAHYLEGPPDVIDRMCDDMRADRAKFELVIVAEKDTVRAKEAPTASEPSHSGAGDDKHFNARASLAIGNASGESRPVRLYPNESLRVVHVEDAPETSSNTTETSSAQQHPETVVLREVALMMNLFSFVPQFNATNRGKGRFETTRGSNLLVKNDPTSIAIGGPADCEGGGDAEICRAFPSATRTIALIAPFGDFWESGLLDVDISRMLRTVTEKAQSFFVDRPPQRSFSAGLCGPHTQDGLYIVIESSNMSYAIDVLTDFLSELNRDPELNALYKPMMVVDHSADVGLIVNGLCTIVGPIPRQLRKLLTVARQEVVPFVTTYRIADLANRNGCHSIGVYVIDKDPAELFTHVTQMGKIGVYAGEEAVERVRRRADEAQRAVDEHVEGPGEIEPSCEKSGIRSATAKEVKQLNQSKAMEQRARAFEAKSGKMLDDATISYFATGTLDAPRPPANLSSTKTVLAAFNDPSTHAAVKSIAQLTTLYKGQPVMKDDAAVRPAGSALHAVRASNNNNSNIAGAAGGLSPSRKHISGCSSILDHSADAAATTRGAQASRVVQSVSYFAPKGIQGDEEFRAIYDALPTAWGGPSEDAGPCATRDGFDAYYYSLEHYGTDPTPAMVDELLGKTRYPQFVTFEQFCIVMNKYQKM